MWDIKMLRAAQRCSSYFAARAAAVALAVLAGLILAHHPATRPGQASAASSPWGEAYFSNATVVTHEGHKLRFYDDLIKDKIVVVNFIYTSCSNICPLTTARLAEVKDQLGDAVGRDIFFYSITLDPVMDGPELLAKYAETYKAGPGWLFLTGAPGDIDFIRHRLGERSRSLNEHRSDVMIGNGRTGEWERNSAFSDVDQLVETIRGMDPRWREQVRTVVSTADSMKPVDIRNTPGQALFIKACAACHTIGHGDLVGPDLAGALDRRDHGWLKSFMMAPDAMRAGKDPIAVALDEKYPGVSMPNLGLSAGDADDLISYLANKGGSTAQNVP